MSESEYFLYASFDLAKVAKPVEQLRDEINSHLATMGVGSIGIQSGVINIGTMKTSRALTREEKEKMKAIFTEEGRHLGMRLEKIRSKPRKSRSNSQSR